MKLYFHYNQEKDISCLLSKGKASHNSQNATKQYEQLVMTFGENPSNESGAQFIEKYIADNKIDIQQSLEKYQQDWDIISDEFQTRAEKIFGVSLPADVTVYLTINSRRPYSIENNYFYVTVPTLSSNRIVMHELWHFYTWYGLGIDQEQKLGQQKYNELKEALTILLNEECKDLLPEGVSDGGYEQHAELREKVLGFWREEKNMPKLWKYFTK